MITLLELWHSWCDIDEHTIAELWYEKGDKISDIEMGKVEQWAQYKDKTVVVFAAIMPDRTCPITHGAFDHILIILKGEQDERLAQNL